MDRRRFIRTTTGLLALTAARPHDLVHLARRPGTTIRVDPRVELYYVILQLSGFRGPPGAPAPVMTELAFPYRAEVVSRFGALRDHPAVTRYADMAPRGFWMGHPISAMLHLGPPPALVERVPVDPFTVRMAGGREPLDAFLSAARQFAVDSGFMGWFRAREAAHTGMVEGARAVIDRDPVADLTGYYGERRRDYTLVLAPLAHPGGFGPRVRDASGRHGAFAVIGPKRLEADRPAFGTPAEMRRLLWHEFSHAHVNHLTERHLPDLRPPVSRLQAHVRDEVEKYVPWDVHVADWVSEHVVRGVTTRLAFRELGPDAGEAALRREIRAFPYVAEVAERLESYERRRADYPTLADFFPELVALFETLG